MSKNQERDVQILQALIHDFWKTRKGSNPIFPDLQSWTKIIYSQASTTQEDVMSPECDRTSVFILVLVSWNEYINLVSHDVVEELRETLGLHPDSVVPKELMAHNILRKLQDFLASPTCNVVGTPRISPYIIQLMMHMKVGGFSGVEMKDWGSCVESQPFNEGLNVT